MIDNNVVYDDEIDLMDIVAVLWKRKKMIMAGTLVVMAVAWIYALLAPEVYQIEMKVKPAVLEIDTDNKLVYASAPEQIKGRIESGIYGQKVLNGVSVQSPEDLPDELAFKVEIPKDADLVSIVYESSDIDFGVKVQEKLGDLLASEDMALLKNKRAFFERQIRINQSDFQENAKLQKSFLLNVGNIDKRISQLNQDIARMKEDNMVLKKERKQLLALKPDGANSLSVLLYSNTIQQTLHLINQVKDQLTLQLEKKEREMQKIIASKRERASINEEIDRLNYKLGTMREMEIVSHPLAGKYPVKPKKILVLMLGFVAGLFLMVFVSFFVEHADNYRKREMGANLLEAK